MAGHSKWANIKHKKGRADAIKGKVFGRVTKQIISAVKQGGPDPDANPKLRLAIQKAKAVNLPNDNIERNIKKASSQDQADYDELSYEIYGFGGVGLIVDVMTDNKNRAMSEMRIATNKRGGTIASPGSVAFNFDKKGVIQVGKEGHTMDSLLELILECGGEDIEEIDEAFVIYTEPDQLMSIKDFLDEKGVKSTSAELEMVPKTKVDCDEETAKQNLALIEWLEDLEDVDAVFHNMS
ncbi:MAG: putative transcriptional regulatory protein [Chlamydiia bacterium]|nr:putative transcriptional regulatory protein [Chlamydiia bacterium]